MGKRFAWMVIAIVMSACTNTTPTPSQTLVGNPHPVTARNLQLVTGQMLYVPAYSQVFSGLGNDTIKLGVTLTIHNTDLDKPIIVHAVRYYNTDGALVRNYVEEAVQLSPLATIGFVIPENDFTGGWGANFIVEWGAEEPVHEPIVEAVMVGTAGSQGISFISEGRILSETFPNGSDSAGDAEAE